MRKILIILAVVVTSCTKNYSVQNVFSSSENEKEKELLSITKDDINYWFNLVESNNKPNLLLADLLKENFVQKDLDFILKEGDNYVEILSHLTSENQALELKLLTGDAPWAKDKAVLSRSVIGEDNVSILSLNSYETNLTIASAVNMRNDYLLKIVETYEEELNGAINDVVPQYALKIQDHDPSLASQVENDIAKGDEISAKEKLERAIVKIDELKDLQNILKIKNDDMPSLIIVGLIANNIIKDLKNHRNFKKIVKVINDFNNKRKKVFLYAAAVKNLKNTVHLNLKDSLGNVKEIYQSLNQIKSNLAKDIAIESVGEMSSAERIRIFHEAMLGKRKLIEKDKASLDPEKYGKHLERLDSAIKNTSASLDNISDDIKKFTASTYQLAEALDIKLGKDVKSILNKADTVSEVIKKGSILVKNLSSGNYLGAVSALSSTVGNGMDPVLSRLDSIDGKLDQVISLQQEILTNQLSTMKMVSDLAKMIDQNYTMQLAYLAELRDFLAANRASLKSLQNSKIRDCESMMRYKASDSLVNGNPTLASLDFKILYGSKNHFSHILKLIKSTSKDGFSNCQNGLTEGFGNLEMNENPIAAIYNSGDDENMLSFQRDVYRPLVSYFYKNSDINATSNFYFPLHIPTKRITDLQIKSNFISNAPIGTGEKLAHDYYELNFLISPLALQRYSNSLLLLYPIIETDKDIWEQGVKAVVKNMSYDIDTSTEVKSNSRAYFLLKNALSLTRSSIAQEALLSGELIIPFIIRDMNSIFNTYNPWLINNPNADIDLLRAIYLNKLLLKNIFSSVILSNKQNVEDYRTAYKREDIRTLEFILGNRSNIFKDRIIKREDQSLYFKIPTPYSADSSEYVKIPKPDIVEKDEVIYSENMINLIALQSKIIREIIKVSPRHFSPEFKHRLASYILYSKNF